MTWIFQEVTEGISIEVTKPRRPAKKILARTSRRASPRNRKRASTQFAYGQQIFALEANKKGLHPERERSKSQTAFHRKLVRQSCLRGLMTLGARRRSLGSCTPHPSPRSLSVAGSVSGVLFTTE